MEQTSPNAPPPPDHHHDQPRLQPTQAFADRVLRALGHRLLLLYRSDPSFYVLGATGNVYVVNITSTLTCTCPDRTTPCKHILFVLIKVLGVALDDACLRRQTLRPCHLARILSNASAPESLAGPSLRQRFQEAFLLQRELQGPDYTPCTDVEEGATCPICLEEMGKPGGNRVVACATCRNPLHEQCLMTWKRTQRRRSFTCVICRSRWRDRVDQERYLNLSAHVSEGDADMAPQSGEGTASTCGD